MCSAVAAHTLLQSIQSITRQHPTTVRSFGDKLFLQFDLSDFSFVFFAARRQFAFAVLRAAATQRLAHRRLSALHWTGLRGTQTAEAQMDEPAPGIERVANRATNAPPAELSQLPPRTTRLKRASPAGSTNGCAE